MFAVDTDCVSTKDQKLSAELHGEALLTAQRPELQPLIDHRAKFSGVGASSSPTGVVQRSGLGPTVSSESVNKVSNSARAADRR
jgi:hypothetical protein